METGCAVSATGGRHGSYCHTPLLDLGAPIPKPEFTRSSTTERIFTRTFTHRLPMPRCPHGLHGSLPALLGQDQRLLFLEVPPKRCPKILPLAVGKVLHAIGKTKTDPASQKAFDGPIEIRAPSFTTRADCPPPMCKHTPAMVPNLTRKLEQMLLPEDLEGSPTNLQDVATFTGFRMIQPEREAGCLPFDDPATLAKVRAQLVHAELE